MPSGSAYHGTTSTFAQRGNSLGDFVAWRWFMLALWLVASALFLGRAIAGRFPDALPSLGLIAVASIGVLITIGLRALLRGDWRASVATPRSASDWCGQLLPSLGNVLLATGFSVAGAYATGLSLLWVIVAVELFCSATGPWTQPQIRRLFGLGQADHGTVLVEDSRGLIPEQKLAEPMAPQSAALGDSVVRETFSDDDESAEHDELPWLWQEATALQELRYISLPEAGLCVTGSQRLTLPAAQHTAVVHTVFYPPFAAAPAVTLEMHEPDTVTIKAAQILPHGIRWELKSEQGAEGACEVQWAFSAISC
jgi:hypothetical protein